MSVPDEGKSRKALWTQEIIKLVVFNIFCLFCSRVVVNIMEFDATFIQVRGLASYKTGFNPPFSRYENACTKSGMIMTVFNLSIRFPFI